jgi:1-acyl-sn-glycerol-3-phosphate acyltransferase
VANHVSWWDGFLLREVHRAVRPDAPLHVVMLEEELRRVAVFRWMGAVPLSSSPLAARRLLRELRSRLERRPDAVLGYFPQGRIWPSHRRPLGFRPGGGWLAGRLAPIAVLPVGLHLEPLTKPGPAAFVSVGPPVVVRSAADAEELEARVTAEVDAILACTRRHGEDAARAWTAGAAGDGAGGGTG